MLHNMKKHDYQAPAPVDKKKQYRVLITTDLEVDDMNGILLTLMYANDYDIAGLVWTAGMFHFSGDGEHTLGDITQHWRCQATHMEHTIANPGELKEFRPVDPHWLERIVDVYYRHDYKWLSQNNPNYPTPEYLLSVTKTGNVAFESDYRYDTEGSDWIKQCILDDDMRPLYIQHWGGINTTVRALVSIYETYHGTDEWESVLNRVVSKVRLQGSGEDYCRADSKIDEMFPGLQDANSFGWGGYGQFFAAAKNFDSDNPMMGTPAELKPYYKSDWLIDAFKFNHGAVMGQFHLRDDGVPIWGEPYGYQYGMQDYIDWAGMAEEGYDDPAKVGHFPKMYFDRMDWMCCQFVTACFVDIGLRLGIANRETKYSKILFEEIAARADWAILPPEYCNHAPIVCADVLDHTAKVGETVSLRATVSDPDGDEYGIEWWIPDVAVPTAGGGNGAPGMRMPTLKKVDAELTASADGTAAQFTVPADAKPGDRFVINMEVRDVAERPMTRFAQFTVTVA